MLQLFSFCPCSQKVDQDRNIENTTSLQHQDTNSMVNVKKLFSFRHCRSSFALKYYTRIEMDYRKSTLAYYIEELVLWSAFQTLLRSSGC